MSFAKAVSFLNIPQSIRGYKIEVITMNEMLNDPDLARIVADITGDGHLQIQEWRYLISFYSKELHDIEAIQRRFFELFAVKGRIYIDTRRRRPDCKISTVYKIFFISKPVALFLRDLGTPVGNKTNKVFTIPHWILNGSSEIKSAYLRGLFDNEGTIFRRSKHLSRWQIGFKMAKNEEIIDSGIFYINQIRQLLSDFSIRCSPARKFKLNIRKDGSQSFDIQFNIEKSSFRNFYKCVGFEQQAKQSKLLQALGECADSQAAKISSAKCCADSMQSPAVPL